MNARCGCAFNTTFPHPKLISISIGQQNNYKYSIQTIRFAPAKHVTKIPSIFQLKMYQIAALRLASQAVVPLVLHLAALKTGATLPSHSSGSRGRHSKKTKRSFPKIKFNINNYGKKYQCFWGGFNHQTTPLHCVLRFSDTYTLLSSLSLSLPPHFQR